MLEGCWLWQEWQDDCLLSDLGIVLHDFLEESKATILAGNRKNMVFSSLLPLLSSFASGMGDLCGSSRISCHCLMHLCAKIPILLFKHPCMLSHDLPANSDFDLLTLEHCFSKKHTNATHHRGRVCLPNASTLQVGRLNCEASILMLAAW